MNKLYIIRGLPGSGKTTFAESICDKVISADDYFIDRATGEYNFRPEEIQNAHDYCFRSVEIAMRLGISAIAVANTFTQLWEFEKYIDLAERHNYQYHVMTMENYHGNQSIHGVPENIIDKMRNRFSIEL